MGYASTQYTVSLHHHEKYDALLPVEKCALNARYRFDPMCLTAKNKKQKTHDRSDIVTNSIKTLKSILSKKSLTKSVLLIPFPPPATNFSSLFSKTSLNAFSAFAAFNSLLLSHICPSYLLLIIITSVGPFQITNGWLVACFSGQYSVFICLAFVGI